MPIKLPEIRVFKLLSQEDRARILSSARSVIAEIENFCATQGFSPLVQRRAWPVATMMAACYGELQSKDLALVSNIVLWIFAFDDVMDDGDNPVPWLHALGARASEVAAGSPVERNDHSLIAPLETLRSELEAGPLWSDFKEAWAESIHRMQLGMLFESHWRSGHAMFGADALPRYDVYMRHGWQSIGVPPMVLAAILLLGDRSILSSLEHFWEMTEVASKAVRLANDIKSEDKELAEGTPNSVVILSNADEMPNVDPATRLESARAQVKQTHESMVRSLRTLASSPRSRSGVPERMLLNTGLVLSDFYTKHDYHTYADETR